MALTLNITFGTACAANNHTSVTVTLSGVLNVSRKYSVERGDLLAPIGDEDIKSTVHTLVKLIIAQLGVKSLVNIKAKVEAKTFDLTVIP